MQLHALFSESVQMKKNSLCRFSSLVIIAFLTAQEIRPVRDSIGYCWNAEQMKHLVEYWRYVK